MVKDSNDAMADTQQMDVPGAKESFSMEMPLPPRVKLMVEIVGGPGTGEIVRLSSGRLIIGRSDADLVIDDAKVSKKHAVIEVFSSSNVQIRDLASTNGTAVNGTGIVKRKLADGDEIKIGTALIKVHLWTNGS